MVYTVVKKFSWEDCYVIHDDGGSWKPKGDDIFYEYKAARVSVMPPTLMESCRRATTATTPSPGRQSGLAGQMVHQTQKLRFALCTICLMSKRTLFEASGLATSCW